MKRAARIAGVICFFISSLTLAAIITTGGGNVAVFEPVRASYVAGQFGAALENEANADTNTVMYCDISNPDGTTSNPLCAISGVKHQGVGPFTDSTHFQVSSDALNFTGDFLGCFIADPVSLASPGHLITAASDGNIDGYELYLKANGSVDFVTSAPGPAATTSTSAAGGVVAGRKNLICYGRNGTDQIVAVNGTNTITADAKNVPATGVETFLGRYPSAGSSADTRVFEFASAPIPATAAAVNAIWAAVQACRGAGRCLPVLTSETFYLNGDNYTVGGDWCGDYPTCTADKTFFRVGVPMVAKSRYNWPSLFWPMTGTVPRVTATAVMDRGFSPKQEYVTGFDGLNNRMSKTIATSPSTFTQCLRSRSTQSSRTIGDAGTSPDTLLTHTTGTTGWLVTVEVGADYYKPLRKPYTFSWYDTGGTLRSVTSTSLATQDDASVCFGHDGTNGWITADSDTPVSAAFDYGPPANGTAMVYGGTTLGTAYLSEFKELMISTVAPTSALLKYLASTPCTAPGDCFPVIANQTMRCNARNFDGGSLACSTGGAWTTTGTLTRSSAVSTKTNENRDSDGAGPFSNANYFTNGTGSDVLDMSEFSCCASISPTALATTQVILSDGQAADTGWYIYSNSSTTLQAVFASPAVTGTLTVGAENIYCWGRAGTTAYAKANGGTINTAATVGWTPGTTRTLTMGRYPAAGGYGATTTAVRSLWCSSTPASDALFTKIQRRFLGQTGTQDRPISVTRSTTLDVVKRGGLVTTGVPGTPRFLSPSRWQGRAAATDFTAGLEQYTHQTNPGGYLITGTAINTSARPLNVAAFNTLVGMTATDNAALAPDGTMTATAIREAAGTAADRYAYAGNWVGTSGCSSWSPVSFYIKPTANRQYYSVWPAENGLVSYARIYHYPNDMMFSGASGAASSIYNIGHEHLDNGWIRVWSNSKCIAGVYIFTYTNDGVDTRGINGDTNEGVDVWGGNFTNITPSHFPPPLCDNRAAGGAEVTCNADVVTISNPLRPNGADWTNVMLRSEELDVSWTAIGNDAPRIPTVTPNAALSPDGSFTADKIVFPASTAANQYSLVRQIVTVAATSHRPSVYLRTESGAGSVWLEWWTGATVYSKECVLTTAWTRCEGAPQTLTAAAWNFALGWDRISGIPAGDHAALTVYAVSYQTETPTLASGAQPLCPTTTAARTCGPGGATGKVTTNLVLRSEALSTVASWTKTNIVSVTGGQADPEGGTGAWSLLDSNDGAPAAHFIDVPWTATAAGYNVTVRAKAGTKTWLALSPDAGASASWFNLATCAAGTQTGGTGTVVSLGGGWCHVQFIRTFGAGATFARYYMTNGDAATTYTGDGTGTILLYKPQIDLGSSGAGSYCGPTEATAKTCAPQQRWCVRVKDATPLGGRTWTNTAQNYGLFTMGTAGAVNTASARVSGNNLEFTLRDALANYKQTTINVSSFTAGSTYSIVFCSVDGVQTLYLDGSLTAASTGLIATGTGILASWPSTITLGMHDADQQWNGTIGAIDFNTTGSPRDFPQ